MEAEGSLKKNLSVQHWEIISDTCAVLEPFMVVQKLLEGETYVTVSLIPYLIFKIRKGLQSVIDGAQDKGPISAQVIPWLSG
jgi:uncharacterized protein YqjF (DUF2071 family)